MALITAPTDIADCVLWCEADQGYTGAQWDDLSGAGNHLTQSTAAKRPASATDAEGYTYLDFVPNASASLASGLEIPASLSWDTRAMTVVIIASTDAPTAQRVLIQPGAVGTAALQTNNSRFSVYDGATKSQSYGATFRGFGARRANWWMRFGSTQSEVGYNDARDTVALVTAATATGGKLGDFASAGFGWDGKIYAFAAWNRELTWQELRDVRRYFDRKYRNPATPLDEVAQIHVIGVGDSITHGTSAGGHGDWMSQVRDLTGGRVQITNLGVPSSQIPAMETVAASYADTLLDASYQDTVLAFWGGTNDIAIGAQSAAGTFARWQAFMAGRNGVGYDKVLALDMLPRGSADVNTSRLALNASIAGDCANYSGCVLVSVASDARIGDAGDNLDTTYYAADAIHLIAAGEAVVAGLVEPEIPEIAAADTPPTITSASEKAGRVGEALSYTITATGTAPITFGVSGALPAGVTFDGTATISGTPTTAGVRVATITATNSAGEDSDTLTFTIAAAPTPGPTSGNLSLFNQLAEVVGATGGHRYNLDALNAISQQLTGSAGHTRNLAALNAIAGFYIGTPQSFTLNIDAINAITGKLGGASNNTRTVDALAGWLGKL